MNLPKCSFIISVYKDTESLELILESLARQTIKPDEVIISEDGNSTEMAQYFISAKEKFSNLDLVHLSQEDIGWRKNIALNRAIMASKYEYLIFIDGEDTDVAMRFKGIGIKLKSCRYSANLIHLYHKKNFNHEQAHKNYQIHQKSVEEKQYICLNGIDKYRIKDGNVQA